MSTLKRGTKILITDKRLPDYGKEFYISHRCYPDSELYTYLRELNDIMGSYEGVKQFKIIEDENSSEEE